MNNEKTIREPLFHITKRAQLPWWRVFGVRAIAIVSALTVAIILTGIILGKGIGDFFTSMFNGTFGSNNIFWNFLRSASLLLCISIAVAPAFKMKFWNIGADGQALMGCVAAYACKRWFANMLPSPALMVLCLISAVVMGAVWALIPALFKAKWNTNETLFTLMMNYIATQIVLYLVAVWAKGTALDGITKGNLIQFYQYLVTVLIVTAVTVAMYFYLKHTKHGYEISVVGEGVNTAKYAGVNIKKVIIRTMLFSGALCGLTGFLLICGQGIGIGLSETVVGGIGFTAIIVAWLAKFNPAYMSLTALFVVLVQSGAKNLNPENTAFGEIIIGIVFFFVIGCEFFLRYQIKMRKKTNNETIKESL